MRINSLGIDVREDHNRKQCKNCGEVLSILQWTKESMGGIMICTNNTCILRNQPQKFMEFEKVRR